MRTKFSIKIIKAAMVIIIAAALLFPLAWMALAGFMSRREVLGHPFTLFPEVFRLDNYLTMLEDPAFIRAMAVTFGGAVLFVLLTLAVNSLAAYAFARLEFTGKRFWWAFCIMPMFIPGMAILLTSFMVVSNLGMLNTLAVLVLPGVASAMQMFFIRQFYLGIPTAVEESAMIDGCSRWGIYWRIFLPQSLPVFTVVGMTAFLAFWNAFVWPVLTITDNNLQQIMPFLANFRSAQGNQWELIMAGSTLAAIPAVILMLIFQRFIVAGVRISGMK